MELLTIINPIAAGLGVYVYHLIKTRQLREDLETFRYLHRVDAGTVGRFLRFTSTQVEKAILDDPPPLTWVSPAEFYSAEFHSAEHNPTDFSQTSEGDKK